MYVYDEECLKVFLKNQEQLFDEPVAETLEEAAGIDRKILKIWEKHPNRMVLPSMNHFFQKAGIIKDFIETLLPQENTK